MAKNPVKYTVYVIPQNGAAPRQFAFSGWMLWSLAVLAAGVLGIGAYWGSDYRQMRGQTTESLSLHAKVQAQQGEITLLKTQLAKDAETLNSLKDSFADLYEFEKKIRLLANLEERDEPDGLLAIGGSFPDDLDVTLAKDAAHAILMRQMNQQGEDLTAFATTSQHRMGSLVTNLEEKRDILSSTPSIRPIKEGWYYTSKFGYRTSPFTGLREFHKGLDVCAAKGTPVMASASGKITYAAKNGRLGNVVVIDHGHGLVTRYAHLDKFLRNKGDVVKRGDIIGQVGNTGRSTGPHLHYEVHLDGIPLNPERYILN